MRKNLYASEHKERLKNKIKGFRGEIVYGSNTETYPLNDCSNQRVVLILINGKLKVLCKKEDGKFSLPTVESSQDSTCRDLLLNFCMPSKDFIDRDFHKIATRYTDEFDSKYNSADEVSKYLTSAGSALFINLDDRIEDDLVKTFFSKYIYIGAQEKPGQGFLEIEKLFANLSKNDVGSLYFFLEKINDVRQIMAVGTLSNRDHFIVPGVIKQFDDLFKRSRKQINKMNPNNKGCCRFLSGLFCGPVKKSNANANANAPVSRGDLVGKLEEIQTPAVGLGDV